MGILAIIIAILAFTAVQSLRKRVEVLEKNINTQSIQGLNSAEQPQEKIENEDNKEHPEELVSFIKGQMSLNIGESDILSTLTKNGWKESDVVEAITYVKGEVGAEPAVNMPTVAPEESAFAKWMKEDWLMKVGALLFIIGIGWFVTYAFMNNWIGPVGRITLGLLSGVAVLALGTWRMRSFKNQGAVLIALGGAIVVITTIAARDMYGFFTSVSALGIIFLTTVFAAFSSVKYSSRALAALSLVLGYFAPILAGGINDKLTLFVYLFVVSAAVLWVSAFTGWRFLAATSLAFVAWFSFAGGTPDNIAILFIFAALYFATNIAAVIKSEKTNQTDVVTAAGLSILLVFWILAAVTDVWQSLLTAGWAVLFVLAAFIVFKLTEKKEPVLIYSGIAAALLGVATAMELSGSALVLAYIYEIAALVLITAFVAGFKKAQEISGLFIIPIALSLGSFVSSSWQDGVIHKDFFVLLSLSAVLIGLGALFLSKKSSSQNVLSKDSGVTMVVVGVLYALALLWLSLHAAYTREVATTIALVVYTLLGIAAYIKGKLHEIKALSVSGSFLLGAVVLRLLFVEAWRLDMAGRIFIFLLIGALLVGTAFIGRKNKNK
jgi:uncharacterized membrane protein